MSLVIDLMVPLRYETFDMTQTAATTRVMCRVSNIPWYITPRIFLSYAYSSFSWHWYTNLSSKNMHVCISICKRICINPKVHRLTCDTLVSQIEFKFSYTTSSWKSHNSKQWYKIEFMLHTQWLNWGSIRLQIIAQYNLLSMQKPETGRSPVSLLTFSLKVD